MQFDMTKQKTTHGPVEAGTYTATIEGAEEGTYNESQYIELTLRLENRRVVWDRLWADNPTKAGFVCEAAGVGFEGEVKCEDLTGKVVSVEVSIDTKGDKPRNRVVSYRPATEGVATTDTDTKIPF